MNGMICVALMAMIDLAGPPVFQGISNRVNLPFMIFQKDNEYITVLSPEPGVICIVDTGRLESF
jgi:hypothetical protein